MLFNEFISKLPNDYSANMLTAINVREQFIHDVCSHINIPNDTHFKDLFNIQCRIMFSAPHFISDTFFKIDTIANIMPSLALSSARILCNLPAKDYTITKTAIANTSILLYRILKNEYHYLKENILNQIPADIPIGNGLLLSVFCSELQLALSPEGRNAPLVPANYSSSPILVYCMALYTCELYEEFIKLHEQIYDKIHSNSLFTDTYNKDVDKILKKLPSLFDKDYCTTVTEDVTDILSIAFDRQYKESLSTVENTFERCCYTYNRGTRHPVASPSLWLYADSSASQLGIILSQIGKLVQTVSNHSDVASDIEGFYTVIHSTVTLEPVPDELITDFAYAGRYIADGFSQRCAVEFLDNIRENYHFDIFRFLTAADAIVQTSYIEEINNMYALSSTYFLQPVKIDGFSDGHIHFRVLINPEIGLQLKTFENPIARAAVSVLCCILPENNSHIAKLIELANTFYLPKGFAYTPTDVIPADISYAAQNWIHSQHFKTQKKLLLCSSWYRHMTNTDDFIASHKQALSSKLFAILSYFMLMNYPHIRKPDTIDEQTYNIITMGIIIAIDTLYTYVLIKHPQDYDNYLLTLIYALRYK